MMADERNDAERRNCQIGIVRFRARAGPARPASAKASGSAMPLTRSVATILSGALKIIADQVEFGNEVGQ